MFKEMRRKEKELNKEEVMKILNEGDHGVLATVNEDGYPYAVPLNYVYYKESIYFHSAVEGQKLNNIQRSSKVSFCVITNMEILPSKFDTRYKSIIAFGNAEEVTEDEKDEALVALIGKYSKGFEESGEKYIKAAKHKVKVIKINIEHISGKEN